MSCILCILCKDWILSSIIGYFLTILASQHLEVFFLTNKVKLGIWLDPVLDHKFREFVAQQYGKVSKGLLSFEVSQALQAWIGTHKGTQAELLHKPPNPIPNVFVVKEEIEKYLKETLCYERVYKVPKSHLIIALSSLRGTDERTIRKWMKLFEKYKVVKWVTPNVIEFL